MYYIQLEKLESDLSLSCLIWRIVKANEVNNISLRSVDSQEKMNIDYKQSGTTANIEINVVKKLVLNDVEYNIGFLDDNYFLFTPDRSGIDEAN